MTLSSNARTGIQLAPPLSFDRFELDRIVDASGTLYAGDLTAFGLPAVRRIALITNVPAGGTRGGHAHKRQSEYLVCVSGGVDVRLESRGSTAVVALRTVGSVLHLAGGVWRDLVDFAPGTVLALLAPQPFDAHDYIHDHAAFTAWEAAGRS